MGIYRGTGDAGTGIPVGDLPDQSGNSGKYLTTDGTDTSWADVSADGLWTQSGTTAYYVTGNVGVNEATPLAALHVTGPAAAPTSLAEFDSASTAQFQNDSANTNSLYVAENGNHIALQATDGTTNSSTARNILLNPYGGNISIGGTSADGILDIRGGDVVLSDADVAHGLTTLEPTNVYGVVQAISGTAGGMQLRGLTDSDSVAFIIDGIIGSIDPTDTTAAVNIRGHKSDGATSWAALADAETLLLITNNTTDRVAILGDGSIGIGTTSPGELLEVASSSTDAVIEINSATSFDAELRLTENGTTKWSILNDGDDSDKLSIRGDGGASDIFATIDQSGNVGIGDTSPAGRFCVKSAASSETILIARDNANSSMIAVTTSASGLATGGSVVFNENSQDVDFRVESNGNANMLFVDGGNDRIGIGTASPGHELTIERTDVSATGVSVVGRKSRSGGVITTGDELLSIRGYGHDGSNFDTQGAKIVFKSTNTIAANRIPAEIQFHTAPDGSDDGLAQRMVIDSAGLVGIGTTSPDNLLHVYEANSGGTSDGNAVITLENAGSPYLQFLGDAVGSQGLYFGDSASATDGIIEYDLNAQEYKIWSNGTQKFTIDVGGNVGIGTAASATTPQGHLTVVTGTCGSASGGADDFVIEHNTSGGMSIMSTAEGRIYFGDATGNSQGRIVYDHTAAIDDMSFWTAGTEALTIDGSQHVGIGISTPDGTLHAWSASAGTVTAHSSGDDFIVENSTDGGMSILVADTANARILFGSPTNNIGGDITYNYNAGAPTLDIETNISGGTININGGGSVTGIQVDGATTSGQTRLLIYDVDNATLERVTVGAADSGGSGFKVLRIPN